MKTNYYIANMSTFRYMLLKEKKESLYTYFKDDWKKSSYTNIEEWRKKLKDFYPGYLNALEISAIEAFKILCKINCRINGYTVAFITNKWLTYEQWKEI